jgi:antitoxin component YwqK of YwqJK toxin-antitoxin module
LEGWKTGNQLKIEIVFCLKKTKKQTTLCVSLRAHDREHYPSSQATRVYKKDGKSFKTKLPNGTKHGESKKYYASGRLAIKSFWKDGKKEGEELQWHVNGQLGRKCFWKDGKVEGEETRWHKNSQLG